jgi:plastocyanin
MTDYAADNVASTVAGVVNERTGTASADTVPAGADVLWRNTGAGTHNITLTTNNTAGGLAVADVAIQLTTGQIKGGRIDPAWGDANGRVQVAIDGTATEIKYYVQGGV